MDAVCTATQVLEDSPRTNAGFGSSLTADGEFLESVTWSDACEVFLLAGGSLAGKCLSGRVVWTVLVRVVL